MRRMNWMRQPALIHAGLGLLLLAGAAVAVQDEPTTRPRRATPSGQVVRPYNLLDDLTAEQEMQLREIRGDYLRKLREIRDEERERSLAVLTREQRERLEELDAERRREAAERRRARSSDDDDADEVGDAM